MTRTPEEKKKAQAAAHKKWRESEKGKAYALKRKIALAQGHTLAAELSPKIDPPVK